MNIRDEIWILSDDRPGTSSQAIGLAERIGFEYRVINLKYNFLASIPNFLFSKSLLRLNKESKSEILSSDYLPRVVISAGRRSATIGLFIKKISHSKTDLIQIMNPNLNFKKFDLVILPKHDEIDEKKFKNLVTTIGSLTKIDEKIIANEVEKFHSWFANISKKKIALIIGGSSKKTVFDEESAKKLAEISSKISNNMDATLLILTSRRSDEKIIEAIKSNLNCDFKFFDWRIIKEDNPYLAILGYSDFFIVSGDSVSMISECCSTGKPVYIFDSNKISTEKHRRFHENLLSNNFAKKLEDDQETLENFLPKKLEETKRVASIIRQNILVD